MLCLAEEYFQPLIKHDVFTLLKSCFRCLRNDDVLTQAEESSLEAYLTDASDETVANLLNEFDKRIS